MARAEEFTFEVKLFIIQELACFVSQAAVVKALKVEFGLEVAPSRVVHTAIRTLGANFNWL